jgi:hypothetical protein
MLVVSFGKIAQQSVGEMKGIKIASFDMVKIFEF